MNRLLAFFQRLWRRQLGDTSNPFEAYVDHAPTPPEAPETPFHVVMPGKYRPILVSSHATFDEAVDAALVEAANFVVAGWFVSRAHNRLWQLCIEDKDGDFQFTKLEVVSSEQLALQQGQPS